MRRLALVVVLVSAGAVVPSAAQGRTISCASVQIESPMAEASGSNIRATGLSCRTARRVVRSYLCRDGRAPYGWKASASGPSYTLLRNGRWRVRFIPAGGVSTC